MADSVFALAHALEASGTPFAIATVVRCDRPTSAKPGAKALIRLDGIVSGWIGGSCAEPTVVAEALGALRDGQPRLLALVGDGGTAPERDGMIRHPMSCQSGGTLEIFIEPVLPRIDLLIVGRGPVAETLAALGGVMDYRVTVIPSEGAADRLAALPIGARTRIVVVTHGAADEEALARALWSDAAYVSLVSSRRRAAAIADDLRAGGLPAERLARLRSPAGLDLGTVTPKEIAASILAELVQLSGAVRPAELPAAAPPARDPVCGMTVDVGPSSPRSEVAAGVFFFCSARCKRAFDQDPARYIARLAG